MTGSSGKVWLKGLDLHCIGHLQQTLGETLIIWGDIGCVVKEVHPFCNLCLILYTSSKAWSK